MESIVNSLQFSEFDEQRIKAHAIIAAKYNKTETFQFVAKKNDKKTYFELSVNCNGLVKVSIMRNSIVGFLTAPFRQVDEQCSRDTVAGDISNLINRYHIEFVLFQDPFNFFYHKTLLSVEVLVRHLIMVLVGVPLCKYGPLIRLAKLAIKVLGGISFINLGLV